MAEQEGVIPQSPSGAEAEATPDPAGQPGSQGGRTLENLQGEFNRKYTQLGERFEALQGQIEKLVTVLQPKQPAQQPVARGPVSPFGAPRSSLEQFSDEHIANYLADPNITPYQRQVLEVEQATRRQLALTNQVFDQRMQQQQMDATKAQAEQAALAAFPALRDPGSDFSQKVKAALQFRRQRFGEFPTDVYDVANNVAREMGLGETRAVTPGTFTAGGFQANPAPAAPKKSKNELTEADIERIGERLAHALPSDRQADGKMKRRTWNKKRVQERSKMYAENADLYKHTKLGSDE